MGLWDRLKSAVYDHQNNDDHVFRKYMAFRFHEIAAPEIIGRILKDKTHFYQPAFQHRITARLIGDSLINSTRETWAAKRALFRPFFTPQQLLTDIAPSILEEAEKLVADWQTREDQVLDLEHEMRLFSGRVILRTIFGDSITNADSDKIIEIISRADIASLRGLTHAGYITRMFGLHHLSKRVHAGGGAMDPYYKGPYYQDRAELDALVQPIINARKNLTSQPRDLLGLMLETRGSVDNRHMFADDKDIRNEILMFIVAGHDTTAVGLTYALLEIIKSGTLTDKITREIAAVSSGGLKPRDHKDLPTLKQVFMEAVRRHPPSHSIGSEAIADHTIGNISFKKGDLIRLNLVNALNHAGAWDNPRDFRPERMASHNGFGCPRGFIAYGEGPRVCPGMPLTFIEATLGLGTIFSRVNFDRATLVEPTGDDHSGFSTRIRGKALCAFSVREDIHELIAA